MEAVQPDYFSSVFATRNSNPFQIKAFERTNKLLEKNLTMTKPLNLIKALDALPNTPRAKPEKLKPRQQRRQEMRDRIKTTKTSQK
jgi:Txe/YoeB family toxin of Txe-Axe toxin-antitoxin module